jgi:flagellar protein FlaG
MGEVAALLKPMLLGQKDFAGFAAQPGVAKAAPPVRRANDSDPAKVSLGDPRKIAESINRFLEAMQVELKLIPDLETGKVIIKVINSQGEVVRQIPAEALVELSSRLGSKIGLLINELK